MTQQTALDILFEKTPADYIIKSDETPDFFQFQVSCGGDICTYRIYKESGKIYEK